MKQVADWLIDERVVMSAIILNALALFGLLSQGSGGSTQWGALAWVDFGCVLFFLAEAATKIGRLSWKGYWETNWNRFDFLVTLLSLPVLLGPWLGQFDVFAFFTVVRLGRLFRLFRLIKFIPHLQGLSRAVPGALLTSTGLLAGLLLMVVILSMGATIFFGRAAPQDFGDPLTSMYSMFRVLTIEGWLELPEDIAAKTSNPLLVGFARFYYAAAVLGGGIFGISLVTALLVEEMALDNNDEVKTLIAELRDEVRDLRAEVAASNRREG